jgi:hypothetical protein
MIGDLQMGQLMHDNIIDYLRRQLHHTPVKVESPVGAAGTPSEPQIHDLDVTGGLHANDLLPAANSVVQVWVRGPCIVLGNSLFAGSCLLSPEQQTLAFEANGWNRAFSWFGVHQFRR